MSSVLIHPWWDHGPHKDSTPDTPRHTHIQRQNVKHVHVNNHSVRYHIPSITHTRPLPPTHSYLRLNHVFTLILCVKPHAVAGAGAVLQPQLSSLVDMKQLLFYTTDSCFVFTTLREKFLEMSGGINVKLRAAEPKGGKALTLNILYVLFIHAIYMFSLSRVSLLREKSTLNGSYLLLSIWPISTFIWLIVIRCPLWNKFEQTC